MRTDNPDHPTPDATVETFRLGPSDPDPRALAARLREQRYKVEESGPDEDGWYTVRVGPLTGAR